MSIVEKIYNKSPKIIQEIGLSTYALKRRRKRNSKYQNEYLEFLMESYYWDEDRINDYQYEELEKVLVNAKRNSKYFSFISYDLIKKVIEDRDLSILPILSKKQLNENFEHIKVNINKQNLFHTSGTTGTPIKVALSDDEWAKEYAFVWRQRKLLGIKQNDKMASFTGRKIIKEDNHSDFWRNNFIDNQLLFSAYHMTDNNLNKYIDKFNRARCVYVQGYPSLIYTIAKYALDNGHKLHSPKGIFTSSETLIDYQRKTIEKAFNSKIYDYYGSTERAGIITQCEYGKYHVNIESGILENINGRFIWTSFINRTTPIIRYDIGDIGQVQFNNERCKCGSCFPSLLRIDGRESDIIYTKDNRPLGAPMLEHIFKKDLSIREAQIIQEKKGAIIIKIVPDIYFQEGQVYNQINKNFHEKIGDSLDIKIKTVKYIQRTENGKFKFIISKINNE